jgi:hypothetical protein
MSQEWTLANVFSRRARERAGSAPTVAGTRHSRTHAHGTVAPVPGHARCTVGEAARSVSPEGLFRSDDAVVVARGADPVPHRGTRRGSGSRRGQILPVTQQPESPLPAPRPAAVPDVGSTALSGDAPGAPRGCAGVESVEGVVITTGGERATLALETRWWPTPKIRIPRRTRSTPSRHREREGDAAAGARARA